MGLGRLAYNVGKYAYYKHKASEEQERIEGEGRRIEVGARRRKQEEMLNAPPEYQKRLEQLQKGFTTRSPQISQSTCENCGNIISDTNRILICNYCGKKFCQTCDAFTAKKMSYKKQRLEFNFPLCNICYKKAHDDAVQRIDKKIKEDAEREEQQRIEGEIEGEILFNQSRVYTGVALLSIGIVSLIFILVIGLLADKPMPSGVEIIGIIGGIVIFVAVGVILPAYLIVIERRNVKELKIKKKSILAINITSKISQQDLQNTQNVSNPQNYYQQPQPQYQRFPQPPVQYSPQQLFPPRSPQ